MNGEKSYGTSYVSRRHRFSPPLGSKKFVKNERVIELLISSGLRNENIREETSMKGIINLRHEIGYSFVEKSFSLFSPRFGMQLDVWKVQTFCNFATMKSL